MVHWEKCRKYPDLHAVHWLYSSPVHPIHDEKHVLTDNTKVVFDVLL